MTFILLLSVIIIGCNPQEVVDEALAKNVDVILRVDCQATAEACEKYCWQNVTILKILKNKSNFKFQKRLDVAHYNWEQGVPIGVSTIYLEKYNPSRNDMWRLAGGGATNGVSHSERPRRSVVTEQHPKARRIISISGQQQDI